MTIHESINTELVKVIGALRDARDLSPATVATAAYDIISADTVQTPVTEFCIIEHLKDMSRRALAHSHRDQSARLVSALVEPAFPEFFSDDLPERCPTKPAPGETAAWWG